MEEAAEVGRESGPRGARGAVVTVVAVVAVLTAAWWGVVRATAPGRALAVHGPVSHPGVPAPPAAADTAAPGAGAAAGADTAGTDTIRVLAWNIAHGRGDLMQGSVQNFRGGSPEVRAGRLARIAVVIGRADADVVVLNEVDFDAAWSGGRNQAEVLAGALGYGRRVEQRNFDYSLMLADFAFGNAVLTRLPVRDARRVRLPPHRALERTLIGAKTAAVVELETRAGPVAVVPVHLEFRAERTRLGAVAPLTALKPDAPPLVLAGDFNTAPPGWPGADSVTAMGRLLDAGWSSPRSSGAPGPEELTFPSPDPRVAIDWVLAEPPLRVLESRVLRGDPELSDHLPVLAEIEVR